MVLVILMVLTCLAMSLLNTCLLESKMSEFFRDQLQACYQASERLSEYETKIAQGKKIVEAEAISDDICGVVFYRITAEGSHHLTKCEVQSTFVKLEDDSHCPTKPTIKQGRQSWRMVN